MTKKFWLKILGRFSFVAGSALMLWALTIMYNTGPGRLVDGIFLTGIFSFFLGLRFWH